LASFTRTRDRSIDLLSGQVQVTFNPLPSSLEFIRAGKVRALAVASAMPQKVPLIVACGQGAAGSPTNV